MLKDNIIKILKTILRKEHKEHQKHSVEDYGNRLSYSCPACGDSDDVHKKRGNIYLDSMRVYCYNGGCSAKGIPLTKFLKSYNQLKNLDITDISTMNKLIKESNVTKKADRQIILEDLMDLDLKAISFSKKDIFKAYSLKPIRRTVMQKYLQSRFQMETSCFAYQEYFGSLFIFNESSDRESVLSLQIKQFGNQEGSKFNSKYITLKWSKLAEKLNPKLLEQFDENTIILIDKISMTYGLSELDFSDDITIFEGYLDAKIYRNSVGMCSANNDFPFLLENKRYMYDNDKAGRKYALKRLNEGERVFLWKKFLKDQSLNNIYDSEGFEIELKDLTDYMKYIRDNKIKPFKLDDYFSNKLLDMLWI